MNEISSTRILRLAETILAQTQILNSHIRDHNLQEPSFDEDGPVDAIEPSTPEIQAARTAALEATIELRQLLEGPVKALLPESNFAPITAIHRYKIATFVPFNGSISFTDLASQCNLLPHDITRIIRYAAVHHRIFQERKPGFVSHTAASRILAKENPINDIMALIFEECWPAHVKAVDAMARKSEEPNETGYALANGTNLNMFEFLNQHPERAKRFAGAMSSTSKASLDALAKYFDWDGLGEGSTVVDVAGSRGHVSIDLAQRYPHLNFVVEDLSEVVKGAEDSVPEDVADRIKFVARDILTDPPSTADADVYLLRFVLHDWSDKYCVEILKQLIPALEHGAKVVIQDHLLPEPGTLSLLQEMQIRSMDAVMLSLFNSRERTAEDWVVLINAVDSRFAKVEVEWVKENPATGVIVATWSVEED